MLKIETVIQFVVNKYILEKKRNANISLPLPQYILTQFKRTTYVVDAMRYDTVACFIRKIEVDVILKSANIL